MLEFSSIIFWFFISFQLTFAQIPGTSFSTPQNFYQCANDSLNDGEGFPDVNLTVPEIIIRNGYPLEVHNITTVDGYILTVFRIYNSRGNFIKDAGKVAVFIQHGFLGSSADWVLNPVEKSIGFKLADAGFDVWLGNSRGTSYSLGHTSLSSDDVSYWDFSIHEMGIYDLPAVIDHILEENGQNNLYYVGHSVGCVTFFIMTSERPEYNQKIRTMIALAPTVFRKSNTTSLNTLLNPLTYGAQPLYRLIGRGRLIPSVLQAYLPLILGYGCTEIFIRCSICQNVLFYMYGYDPYQMNYTQLPTIMAHEPDSVSSKTFIHLSQMEWTGLFQQFDYNPYPGNIHVYGTLKPPLYDLSKATLPVVIFKGLGDTRALPNNVDKLARILPNVKENNNISFPQFNHLDFLFAKDVNIYLYDYLQLILQTDKYYE